MVAIETLTDKAILSAETAKGRGKPCTISDGGGLSLQVQTNGAGWWRLRYWIASKENRLSPGTYPDVSLATARERRRDASRLIAAGTDPSTQRKMDKALRQRDRHAQALADAGVASAIR